MIRKLFLRQFHFFISLVFIIIHWAHTVQMSSLRSLLMFRYNHDWCTKIIPKKWSMEWKDMMTRFSGSIVCDRFIRWWRLRKLHQTIIRPIPPTSPVGENALRGLDETTLADSLWCALNFKGAHVLGCNTFAFEWIAPTERGEWSVITKRCKSESKCGTVTNYKLKIRTTESPDWVCA